jgi:cadmium resistance protein CadD (predicted permease)
MELVVTAIAAFIATNLDDLLVLTLLFGTRRMTNSSIMLGQYAGILALVIISMAASVLGYFIDVRYFGFMGFFPIGLGLVQFYRHVRRREEEAPQLDKLPVTGDRLAQIAGVASLTIGNGGDNISVYTPLFAVAGVQEYLVYFMVFMIMIALWCWLGYWLARHPVSASVLGRYGYIVNPLVFAAIGLYIVFESRVLTIFAGIF